ncbi:site-specific integrase [Xenorhabdus bovienii]|uniref:Putative integrase DLP12 prophage n=1 Tax=Xenorhabdus bovienii str. kraussei Becker Underwood TaxID=1398204 RepID=A0A077PWJ4_XENBV|nr:site-specific integrase [Xenorhabdus bovienii]CDH24234.1 putative integrase; DLP12 prophage [Xenorhabdus bovienii str. kraussei Becker Underwood]
MSIFRRNQTWYADITIPGGKRIKQSLGTEDKRQAQELHDKLRADLWRVDKLGDYPDITFEEACVRWLEEKSEKKSLDTDKSLMGFWLEHFSGCLLNDITSAKIYSAVSKMQNRAALANWLAKKEAYAKKGKDIPTYVPQSVSQSTKSSHLALMKSILRAAEREWKWLDKAPIIKVNQPKNKRIRWLELHEAIRLISECPEPLKSVVRFALATGLRRSNIIDLEWQQIDMQRKAAWVNPEDSKSGKAIGVALNDTACQVLRDQIGNHHKWVFVHKIASNRNDGTMTPAIRKMRVDNNRSWNSALKRAGIEDLRFHDLRHTWASWLPTELTTQQADYCSLITRRQWFIYTFLFCE